MRSILFPVMIITAALFSSCSSVKPLSYQGFENFKVSDAKSNPKVNVDVKLHNPGPIGGKLKHMDIQLKMQNTSLGEVALDHPVRMKAKKDFTVPVTVQTSMAEAGNILLGNASSLLSGKQMPFELSGSLTIQKFIFFRKTFQFDFKDQVSLKDVKIN